MRKPKNIEEHSANEAAECDMISRLSTNETKQAQYDERARRAHALSLKARELTRKRNQTFGGISKAQHA